MIVFDTEYDRAKVPPYNGNDPPPAPGSLKRSLFPTLLNEVQNKGTQGVRARYGAELPPIISIVRYPGRPVISVPDVCPEIKQKQSRDRKTIFETPSLPVAKILSPVARQAPTTFARLILSQKIRNSKLPGLFWRQFWCVAGMESDFPRASGTSLDFPEFPRTSPEVSH